MNNLGKKIFPIILFLLIGFNFIIANENSGQKNISIIGFVDREGSVVHVGIYSIQGDQLIARNHGQTNVRIRNNNITLPLFVDREGTPWTGEGSFIVIIVIGKTYIYTSDLELSTLGVNSINDFNKLPTVKFESDITTIDFKMFRDVTIFMGD